MSNHRKVRCKNCKRVVPAGTRVSYRRRPSLCERCVRDWYQCHCVGCNKTVDQTQELGAAWFFDAEEDGVVCGKCAKKGEPHD